MRLFMLVLLVVFMVFVCCSTPAVAVDEHDNTAMPCLDAVFVAYGCSAGACTLPDRQIVRGRPVRNLVHARPLRRLLRSRPLGSFARRRPIRRTVGWLFLRRRAR